jgi:hypothetical protein
MPGIRSVADDRTTDWLCILNIHLEERRTISDSDALKLARIMHEVSHEDSLRIWAQLQCDVSSLFKVHPYIERLMIHIACAG